MPKAKEKRLTKKGKGVFCAAYGCTNTYLDNVSLHQFPNAETRPAVRRQWIAFVKNERKDFDNPSQYMRLCEQHFEESCYPPKYKILKSEGKEDQILKKTLLPDAVPTIHAAKSTQDQAGPSSMASTSRGENIANPRPAYRKRECERVSLSNFYYSNKLV